MIFSDVIEYLYWNLNPENFAHDQGDFGSYYAHLENVLIAAVKSERNGRYIPELSPEYRTAFNNHMKKITIRTLLFEMELSEDCGELPGETKEARYRYYADHILTDPDSLRELYKVYPLLYQDMLRCLEASSRNICDLLNRFETDHEGLNRRFYGKNPCSSIKRIGGGDSDAHNGGQSVFFMELDNGEKLAYKPRSLAADEVYKVFLQWVCEKLGVEYWWNPVWDRGEYGWCGWVTELSCHSYEELKRYYYRNGILLGLGYLLGSRDMHYENIIAHGEYPVIVDLEMGIGSQGTEGIAKAWTGVEQVFQESVLRTGILPTYAWDDLGNGINVGAIDGSGGQLAPFLTPVIVNSGTVQMHVEYRQPVMKEGRNLATLEGTFLQPWEFREDLEAGFEAVYSFFMENRAQALLKLELFRGVKLRYLARHTQEYSLLLMTMYHPDYMATAEERHGLLTDYIIGENREEDREQWISAQEMVELEKGDIPYFWYCPDRLELHSGTGERYEVYFQVTAFKRIQDRLNRMSEIDLHRQRKLIRASLLMGDKSKKLLADKTGAGKAGIGKGLQSRQNGLSVADRIGKLLLEEAIWSEDRKDVGWISILMAGYQEQSYLIRPMGWYLYDGLAGVALFMHRLGTRTGKKCYRDMAKLLLRKLYAHTWEHYEGKQTAGRPTGAFSGEASIAFTYMLLYKAEPRQELMEYLYLQCKAVAAGIVRDEDYDVLGGNAGAIMVFLAAYEMTGNEQYICWAGEAGDSLLKAAETFPWGLGWRSPVLRIPLTGFAHGASGIMLALSKLGYYTKEERYHQAAYQAYMFEEHYYDAEAKDWLDLRSPEGREQEYNMAWCHGWGGIIMARRIAEQYADGCLKEALKRTWLLAVEKEAAVGLGDTFCLCHGNSGNAALYSRINRDEGQALMDRSIARLGESEEIRDCLGIQECGSFGLLGGITGIGYSCLCGIEEVAGLLGIELNDVACHKKKCDNIPIKVEK